MSDRILSGIKILDLTTGLAGPVATALLAEAGAEVVKIESPAGDPSRDRAAAGFETWNRSKAGLTLDLQDPVDRSRLDQLMATADVLVHEFPPALAQEMGLDDDRLAQEHPKLIVASVLGFPRGRSDAGRPGEEILVQARSGVMDEQLSHRPGPCFIRFPLASWPTAYLLAVGILTRLLVRRRTGRAGPIHTSLLQGLMAVLAMLWNDAEKPTQVLSMKFPLPKALPIVAMTLFECSDGVWLQTLGGFMEQPLVLESCAMLGEEPPDVGFQSLPTPEDLVIWRRLFATRPAGEWLAAFHAAGVPAEIVQEMGSVFTDPQVLANDYVVDVDHPRLGRVRQTAAPFTTDPPSQVSGPAPARGGSTWTGWASPIDGATAAEVPGPGTSSYPDKPLAGLTVLDFGSYLAGPLGPMLMADLGANVVKIEAPTGERMRKHEVLFLGAQRGKRSLALDMSRAESRPVLAELIRSADVIHHNMRGPAAHELGVDADSIRAINPDAVFCNVSSYGPLGDKGDWPGYDPTAQAASGWMITGAGQGNPPLWHRFGMMDHQAALASLVPTLLALYQRETTGRATAVSCSLLGAATMTNSETYLDLDSGQVPAVTPVDPDLNGLSPYYRIYAVGDGHVAVSATARTTQVALRELVGVPDGDDESVSAGIEKTFASWRTDELLEALEQAGVPAELVRLDQELAFLRDEENVRLGLAVSYEHGQYGKLTQPGAFWDFGDLSLALDRPPPLTGQHTLEILQELGVDHAQIARLHSEGVIAGPGL